MGFDIGSLLGSIVSGTGLGIGKSGMHAPTPEQQGADILREAAAAGVSPLALLPGGANFQSGSGASVGDSGTAGQLLARSITSDRSADDRLNALKEQNLALQNAQLTNDVVAGQMRNSIQRTNLAAPGTPPARLVTGEAFGPFWPPGVERPKPMLQALVGLDGKVVYAPSPSTQQALWSPLPGLPANPAVAADVVRANAAAMPPDVARMSGLPPGAYPFVPGTADWSWRNLLPF